MNLPMFRIFMTKHKVEKYLEQKAGQSAGKMSYTILRPTFFMDNLMPGFFGKMVATAWRDWTGPKTPLQLVDTVDIGQWAADAFYQPEDAKFKNKAITLAGDEMSFEEADKLWREKTGGGIPTTFSFLASLMLYLISDLRLMFLWFKYNGYRADIKALNGNRKMVTMEEWIDRELVKKTQ
jgi:hypothetical protein